MLWLSERLHDAGAAYTIRGAAAAWLQGAATQPSPPDEGAVEVQWDFIAPLHSWMHDMLHPSPLTPIPGGAQFCVEKEGE